MIHIYYGNGKGKTTAALGLAMRARGDGWSCGVLQFLKDRSTGELDALRTLGIEVWRGKANGAMFTRDMPPESLAETRSIHDTNLWRAITFVESFSAAGKSVLLVLDELLDAISLKLIDETILTRLLDLSSPKVEIVITGHGDPPANLRDRAHYITEMSARAHPYEAGIAARQGIEF
ncbi:MAG: cob(I)yrinic acid a,c-diamide adenosyltransferase [Oscillospiraceae bacterium]|jgi:cob(I)alamin adenosyltransferase|nr:cob(I)yrinic acid a,c-diamide adenosyltransferase [Oscillospiraceae bacterium]